MARGKISKLHPPGNNGARDGAGKITPDDGGNDIVFQTPRDVAAGTVISEGMSVSYDGTANGVSNIRTAIPVPTCTLSSDPNSIVTDVTVFAGNPVTLYWTSQYATSLVIDNNIGDVTNIASHSVTFTPVGSSTYTLTASNASGSASAGVNVVSTLPRR